MNSGRTYDIFLSYPHADRVEVARVCRKAINNNHHNLLKRTG